MGAHKQSVSFTGAAFNFACQLVESGEYANTSTLTSVRPSPVRWYERALRGN
jgi:hypothetical protein